MRTSTTCAGKIYTKTSFKEEDNNVNIFGFKQNNMSKKKYITIAILVVVTRILDGVSTYLVTPDLKYEMNFLVKHFSLGWFPFLTLGVLLIIVTLLVLTHSYKNQKTLRLESSSLENYVLSLFYDDVTHPWMLVFKLPKKKSTTVFIGFVFSISLVLFSFFLICNNTFMFLTDYSDFLYEILVIIHQYNLFALINVLVLVIIIITVSYKVLRDNYQISNEL